jgi:hypothetical protein
MECVNAISIDDISSMCIDELSDRRIAMIGLNECFMCCRQVETIIPFGLRKSSFVALPTCHKCFHIVKYISHLFENRIMINERIAVKILRTCGKFDEGWIIDNIEISDNMIFFNCKIHNGYGEIYKKIPIMEMIFLNPNLKVKLHNVPMDLISEIKCIVSSQRIYFEEHFYI